MDAISLSDPTQNFIASNQPASKRDFEIGRIYVSNSRWYIAISESQLLTFIAKSVKILTPYRNHFKVNHHVTFEDLCNRWNLSEDALDKILNYHIVQPGLRSFAKVNSHNVSAFHRGQSRQMHTSYMTIARLARKLLV